MNDDAKKREFTRVLFRWHRSHYRSMPWRDTHDPYLILISEIMLQQTQVDRVRAYYEAFVTTFPTVQHLAKASLADVLLVWSGLGYNRRAKYIHACAIIVTRDYGGNFPDTYEALVSLPGIGRSTAGALLAFAFGQDTPMIDTNIRRILSRVFFPLSVTQSDAELYVFASSLIPEGKGRMWNYAMLDVGAQECLARGHRSTCPLASLHGPIEEAPPRKKQIAFRHTARYVRGRVIQLLTQTPRVREKDIPVLLQLPASRIEPALLALASDGMVTRSGGRVSLPR
jgi:A/G-specific adenine glycosylase